MGLLEIAGVLVVFGGGAAVVARLWSRAAPPAPWAPFHRYEDGSRHVYVRRGSELEPVGQVASADPDYDEAFMRLMDRARERAAVLNAER